MSPFLGCRLVALVNAATSSRIYIAPPASLRFYYRYFSFERGGGGGEPVTVLVAGKEGGAKMEDAVTLSATLRRASPLTRRRALVILFALRSCARKHGMALSLPSITTALEFSMAGKPVRFLFATGGRASVLRSHDRGGTWRIAYRVTGTSKEPVEEVPPANGTATMEDLVNLLPSSEAEQKQKEDSSLQCSATALETQITHVTALKDMVAVCGSRAFLAVSVDRGMNFVAVKEGAIYACMTKEPGAPSSGSLRVEGVAFLSEQLLLFSCKNLLFSIDLIQHNQQHRCQQPRLGAVALGDVRLIKRFAAPIGCLKTFPRTIQSMCELFVSTRGTLHYSSDGGRSFLTFQHKLGIIRVLEPLDMVLRRGEVPQLPKALVTPMLSTSTECAKDRKPEKYVYSAISHSLGEDGNDHGEPGAVDLTGWAVTVALPYCTENVHYRVLLVGGIGTSILPYDYTAQLFIAAALNISPDSSIRLGSLAESVEYMPYVRSGAAEPTSIALCRRPGSSGCVVARSNASGVSLSRDMGRSWTTPTQAYTVAVVAMDGGEFVCCNRRNVVSTIHGSGTDVHSVPTELRVPYLTNAAVML
ncbi:uncharacterized protein Tco025E_00884 [Trypanosoma conorhini]|uniref:Uncharacterized protein n=1 Tax=Trypanosoma conorhini TaxID=83891 RepID=A0A422QAD8_9TRYP|nr:uncharacterized protein Tco025E_00884 [Trypanosoma conorhini]RNF26921.1 hypothetical protein Tco025E_00884 [Trypanosoma conorhini]